MAALTTAQINATWRQWVDDQVVSSAQPIQFNQADLRAAVAAVDAWATANSASFNSALPEPFKSAATATQKAALLAYVITRRFTG